VRPGGAIFAVERKRSIIDQVPERGAKCRPAHEPNMSQYELYGTRACPYTQEMREWLELRRREDVEFDVEADPAALVRMLALSGGRYTVPVLVEDGRAVEVGWQGRGCIVGSDPTGA
jgi:glutaredoxin 3